MVSFLQCFQQFICLSEYLPLSMLYKVVMSQPCYQHINPLKSNVFVSFISLFQMFSNYTLQVVPDPPWKHFTTSVYPSSSFYILCFYQLESVTFFRGLNLNCQNHLFQTCEELELSGTFHSQQNDPQLVQQYKYQLFWLEVDTHTPQPSQELAKAGTSPEVKSLFGFFHFPTLLSLLP